MFTAPALVGLLAVASAAPVPADREPERPPLTLSVALPAVHGQRVLPYGGTFTVVVTNTSAKPVRVWRDWCSWGYFNLSLGFEDGDAERVVEKEQRGWNKNYPDAAELAPGESILFPVTLTNEVWKDLGLKDRVGRKVKMRVRYCVPPDDDAVKLGVWAGTLRTAYQTYTVENAR